MGSLLPAWQRKYLQPLKFLILAWIQSVRATFIVCAMRTNVIVSELLSMLRTPLPSLDDLAEQKPEWLYAAVDDAEASQIVGHSTSALATLRSRGGGPPFIKSGKSVRYIRRDLLEWLYDRRVRNTSESR
jgi:hypothetical protein